MVQPEVQVSESTHDAIGGMGFGLVMTASPTGWLHTLRYEEHCCCTFARVCDFPHLLIPAEHDLFLQVIF